MSDKERFIDYCPFPDRVLHADRPCRFYAIPRPIRPRSLCGDTTSQDVMRWITSYQQSLKPILIKMVDCFYCVKGEPEYLMRSYGWEKITRTVVVGGCDECMDKC